MKWRKSKYTLKYPESGCMSHTDTIHGVSVPDPYRWMEDIDSLETQEWIKAQNSVASEYIQRIPIRERIHKRMTELWNYERYSVPFRRGGRYFIFHNNGLQDQSVLYWMESLDGKPKVLLDPNQLSEDGTVALAGYSISEDGKLMAYGLSASGSDWMEWHVREVDSGQDMADHLKWVKFSGASWTHDCKGFFYSRYDEPEEGTAYKDANYYHKIYYHKIGTPQADDELIYERPDQKEWNLGGRVTEDGRYLIISASHGTRRENGVFYRDLQENDGKVVELLNKFDAKYSFIANDGQLFYFITDLNSQMSRVTMIDITDPAITNWKQIIAGSVDPLQSVSLVNDMFIASYLHDAYSLVRIFDMTGKHIRDAELPGIGTVSGFSGRREYKETFFDFSSFNTPGAIYRYDMETGESTVFRKPEVAFNPDDYITKQVLYQSKDGTCIPMFICHKRDLERDANTPTYLYGYGGFNISLTPSFSLSILTWMEMGGIFAQPSLRGGGEYGKSWHEAGSRLKKQNVFDDFIAAAQWLIDNKYTSTPKLAIAGGSNGGLLVGACMIQRPDLFGACVPAVGVLDMLRFHKFTIGWAWTSDYGSPDDPEEFEALLAYSPYHNVKSGTAYPPTLITTGDHDDRVFPAHSFKFAAALQTAQSGDNPVLIRIDTKAGHGAGKPISKTIEELADRWAFILRALKAEDR